MIFWPTQSIQRSYISEIDQFLEAYDKKPEATSLSRKAEEAKYREITRLMDPRNAKDSNDGR